MRLLSAAQPVMALAGDESLPALLVCRSVGLSVDAYFASGGTRRVESVSKESEKVGEWMLPTSAMLWASGEDRLGLALRLSSSP